MGSVVLDAVNSFFSHASSHSKEHVSRDTPRQTDHSPEPERRRAASVAAERASSFTRRTTSSVDRQSNRDIPKPQIRTSDSAQMSESRVPSRPPSPPLAARPAPPSADELQAAPAAPVAAGAAVASDSGARQTKRIKIRDLQHIQELARADTRSFSEIRSRSRSRSRGGPAADEAPEYEISGMKVEEIIEMVARLLTKITATNDRQHEHLHRQPPSMDSATHLNPQTTSVLAFHGKNVPSITIQSYLSRINKYCPTSYDVFLSLLVYFDRMTEKVNAGPMQSLREANKQAVQQQSRSTASSSTESFSSDKMDGVSSTKASGSTKASDGQLVTPPSSGSMEHGVQSGVPGTPHSRPNPEESPAMSPELHGVDAYNLSHFFVVDSFNIHRLVIAGVTCASKFFSDIFYTNSRYAKVGGLPLAELNHLELQFLILNEFRLAISVEEMEAYGTMLVEFYAREFVAQQKAADAMQMRSLSESSSDSTSTVVAG